jgi:hypothetical protein
MDIRLAVVLVASMVGLGACTTAQSTPATVPSTTGGIVTSTTASTTTTTMLATTSTLDRLTEIQAIFQDLEVRRLQAIMDHDEEAFRAVFANAEYGDRSVGGMELVTVLDPDAVVYTVVEVFVDGPQCIAVSAFEDATAAIEGSSVDDSIDHVLQRTDDGWGFSWIGSGWRCNGPHPFSD